MTLTVTDLFAGCGGSSLGAEAAGATLRMAANHWALAVDSHAGWFTAADHDCADISQCDPRRYPTTDILIASPECTTHSQSGGRRHEPNLFNPDGDPSVERSRATMWDVPRFAEFHQYRCVIVENVTEIRRWAPYQAWLEAMRALGYEHREMFVNSMTAHPTPQSRDRIYVVFWRKGAKAPDLNLTASAWCPSCETIVQAIQTWKNPSKPFGKYKAQYLYRCPVDGSIAFPFAYPALSAIDLSLPAPRIGDRKKPLAVATMRRIEVCLNRFGIGLVQHAGHTYERPGSGYSRCWPMNSPTPTMTGTLCHGLASPPEGLVVPVHHDESARARSTSEPWPTQTGRQELALAIPMCTGARAHDVSAEPVPTVTTGHAGAQTLVTIPAFIAELRGGWSVGQPVTNPLAAVCASGNHHALVVPYHGNGRGQTTDQPLPTQDTRDRYALVVKNYGDGSDPSMGHFPTEPFGAVTTKDHHSIVETDHVPVAVEDCGFRMLEPHEIQAAMAFPREFKVLGNKRDRVRQLGNAVTPPVLKILMERCVESLS